MSIEKESFIVRQQFDQFVKEFVEGHEQPKQEDVNQFIEQIKILERFSIENRFYTLFDQSRFFPIYLSENIKKTGFTADYISKQGLLFGFRQVYWKHMPLAYKVTRWGNRFNKLAGSHRPITYQEAWFCGVKFKDRWNKWWTFLVKQKMLAGTKENKALLSFL